MKIFLSLLAGLLLGSPLIAADPPSTAAPQLPNIRGVAALATVNGEPVSWTYFIDALASVHADAKPGAKRAKQDPHALLDRLITGKLVAQEARNIGLDQTPEFQAAVAAFRQDTLSKLLLERPAKTVTRSDPADVERLYRASAGLAKFDSVFFEKQADAEAFAASVRSGKEFGDAARAALAAGKAKSFDQGGGGKLAELQPDLVNALAAMKAGQSSAAIPLQQGWTVARLLELSIPEDPQARAKAEADALAWKRLQAVRSYSTDLRKRLVKIDQALLDALDFEAKAPGLAGFKKDSRVVATVRGAKSVTVGDLATEVERAFFHGTAKAAEDKKVNPKKYAALDELLVGRLTLLEAVRLGLDKTPEFRDSKREFEDGLLFTAFLKKVILPDVKVSEAEIKSWYDTHKGDYSSPTMLRLDSIAFAKRADAEDAWKKCGSGADFGWLKKNASGQVPNSAGVMQLNGGVFVADQLDPELTKALSNPKGGDARVYAAPGGPAYTILIREVIPSRTETLEAVRNDIGQSVVDEKTKRLLDDWSTKLRKGYEVKTFVTTAQLDALVKREFARKA